jgi:hypothetical protein
MAKIAKIKQILEKHLKIALFIKSFQILLGSDKPLKWSNSISIGSMDYFTQYMRQRPYERFIKH